MNQGSIVILSASYQFDTVPFGCCYILFGLVHEILVLIVSVSSEGSDEPAHSCSLTIVVTAHTHKVRMWQQFRYLVPLDGVWESPAQFENQIKPWVCVRRTITRSTMYNKLHFVSRKRHKEN